MITVDINKQKKKKKSGGGNIENHGWEFSGSEFSWYHLLAVIRVAPGSFSVYSRQHITHFEHTLWSIKYCVYKCVSHCFLHRLLATHLCIWNCFLGFLNKKYEINCDLKTNQENIIACVVVLGTWASTCFSLCKSAFF